MKVGSIPHRNTVLKTHHKGVLVIGPFQNVSLPNNIHLTPSTMSICRRNLTNIVKILPITHIQVKSSHTISQAQNSRHHNKILLLKHRHLSRPMYFRSRTHVDLGLFQSHRKQVLATITLQANQHSSQMGFFHSRPELLSQASRTLWIKACCWGQLHCFPISISQHHEALSLEKCQRGNYHTTHMEAKAGTAACFLTILWEAHSKKPDLVKATDF